MEEESMITKGKERKIEKTDDEMTRVKDGTREIGATAMKEKGIGMERVPGATTADPLEIEIGTVITDPGAKIGNTTLAGKETGAATAGLHLRNHQRQAAITVGRRQRETQAHRVEIEGTMTVAGSDLIHHLKMRKTNRL